MAEEENAGINASQIARIAVYDDMLSAPRIVDIEPTDTASYIENIASTTYELAQKKGSSIPYSVIREVTENFIHARFQEPCVSILDNGNTIRFADQGPGIENKDRAQLPGFTSATSEMKEYIRGVGSGFPLVKEYLKFSNGRLVIEDNIKEGTVITITVEGSTAASPVVYQTQATQQAKDTNNNAAAAIVLKERDFDILYLASQTGTIGPTEVHQSLNIPVSTAYRLLGTLEDAGYLKSSINKGKKSLTNRGYDALNSLGR